jgi:hypothetical protein
MAILLYQIKGMTLDEDKNLLQVQAGSEVGRLKVVPSQSRLA